MAAQIGCSVPLHTAVGVSTTPHLLPARTVLRIEGGQQLLAGAALRNVLQVGEVRSGRCLGRSHRIDVEYMRQRGEVGDYRRRVEGVCAGHHSWRLRLQQCAMAAAERCRCRWKLLLCCCRHRRLPGGLCRRGGGSGSFGALAARCRGPCCRLRAACCSNVSGSASSNAVAGWDIQAPSGERSKRRARQGASQAWLQLQGRNRRQPIGAIGCQSLLHAYEPLEAGEIRNGRSKVRSVGRGGPVEYQGLSKAEGLAECRARLLGGLCCTCSGISEVQSTSINVECHE